MHVVAGCAPLIPARLNEQVHAGETAQSGKEETYWNRGGHADLLVRVVSGNITSGAVLKTVTAYEDHGGGSLVRLQSQVGQFGLDTRARRLAVRHQIDGAARNQPSQINGECLGVQVRVVQFLIIRIVAEIV